MNGIPEIFNDAFIESLGPKFVETVKNLPDSLIAEHSGLCLVMHLPSVKKVALYSTDEMHTFTQENIDMLSGHYMKFVKAHERRNP